MKKILILVLAMFIYAHSSIAYCYSESFSFLIETMEIDVENKNGKELNEDVYNSYSLFVYGSPLDGYAEQRWKDVSDGGCSKGVGIWNGAGSRGEYWILR